MNAPASAPRWRYERLRLTVDAEQTLVDAGLINPDARTELIDGELFFMPSDGGDHINYKAELTAWFIRRLADTQRLIPDSTLHLGPSDTPRPDLYVCDASAELVPIDPAEVYLILEVADSSLGRDLNAKAAQYARFGVAEYWVVDIGARVTHVHRAPWNGSYPAPKRVPFDAGLQAEALPDLPPLVIAELPRLD